MVEQVSRRVSDRRVLKLVRCADDLVVLCRRRSQAREALRRLSRILGRLHLKQHPSKTRLVELGLGKDGFDFLGCYLRIVCSHFKRKRYLFRWPSPRAMTAVRARVRDLTDRRSWAGTKDIREVIRDLNPVLRGWGNYFQTGNVSLKFRQSTDLSGSGYSGSSSVEADSGEWSFVGRIGPISAS